MNDEHDQFRRRPSPDRRVPGQQGANPVDQAAFTGLGEHIDMRQVHFDDAFLDALSRDVPTPTRDDAEYQLAELLSGWRHESLAQPAPPLPDLDEVETAMAVEEPARHGARVVRSLRVVAAAAAIAVVAAAGLTVVSEGAQPGDSLWSVKKVVLAEAASETQAAYDVRSDLEQAEAALAVGNDAEAQKLIARAESQLGPVRDSGTREQMSEWIDRLRADDPSTSETTSTTLQHDNPDATSPTEPDVTATSDGTTPPDTSKETTTPPTTTVPTTTSVPATSATPTSAGQTTTVPAG